MAQLIKEGSLTEPSAVAPDRKVKLKPEAVLDTSGFEPESNEVASSIRRYRARFSNRGQIESIKLALFYEMKQHTATIAGFCLIAGFLFAVAWLHVAIG